MAGGSDRRATSRRNIPWPGGGRRNTVPDGSVFISYRRGDSAGHTGRLYDGLSAALGDAAVFMDIDAIDPGVDFAQRIRQALTICRVALVVIGPRWISAAAPDGARRLDDPEDYLRVEIAAALRRDDVVVVPVLVAGADMPTREQLPEPLQPLALRHAFELSDSRWVSDVGHLVDVVRRAVQRPDRPPSRACIPSTILAIALILAIAGGGWLIWTAANPTGQAPDDGSGGDPPAPTESAQAPSPGPTGHAHIDGDLAALRHRPHRLCQRS